MLGGRSAYRHTVLLLCGGFVVIQAVTVAAGKDLSATAKVHTEIPPSFVQPESADAPVRRVNKGFFKGTIEKSISISPEQLEGLLKVSTRNRGGYPLEISGLDVHGPGQASGLASGDRIMSAYASRNVLTLGVARRSELFRLQIDLNLTALDAVRPTLDAVVDPASPAIEVPPVQPTIPLSAMVKAQAPKPAAPQVVTEAEVKANRLLAQKQIVLIIDCSRSMSTRDCPGNNTRWDWCRGQTLHFGFSTPEVLRNGLTVIPFSSGYKVYQHATLMDVQNIYTSGHPSGMTYLCPPLTEAISNYLNQKRHAMVKPLVVAVVTDGYPVDVEKVKQLLIRTSHRVSSPSDMRVVFIQISDDTEGSRILADLDDNLVTKGAHWDLVDTESFSNVRRVGFKQALVDAIMYPHSSSHRVTVETPGNISGDARGATNSPEAELQKRADKIRAERLQLERMLLGR